MPVIEVDQEVLDWLKSRIRDFNESPNTVIRRELGLDRAPPAAPSPQPRDHSQAMASLPLSVPEALAQILHVVRIVRRDSVDRITATLQVAHERGVARETVGDKYGRQLGLTTAQFDRMLAEPGMESLRLKLETKFPRFRAAIRNFFSGLEAG